MQNVMDGIREIYAFNDIFVQSQILLATIESTNGYNQENFDKFQKIAVNLNSQEGELMVFAKRGIFTQRIVDMIQSQNNTVQLTNELNMAFANKDLPKVAEIADKLKQEPDYTSDDWVQAILEWGKVKNSAVFVKQDEMHQKSWDMYKQAYLYAKNKQLNSIISVWDNIIPGFESSEKSI